ncbi:MAG TPA: hypothetical protein VG889_12615 [Rhizomicrobium sp.]|nr:hypothetical protein [Rhizomicrobium sp.]
MTDETVHILMEYMRRFNARMDEFFSEQRDMKLRLSSIKHKMVNVHSDLTGMHGDVARIDLRLHHIDTRLARIEKRLDLTPA